MRAWNLTKMQDAKPVALYFFDMNKTALFFVALTLSGLTLFVLLALPSSVWANWQPATCLPDGCFCEAENTASPIRQMANTLSSLGYVFSGVWMMRRSSNKLPFLHSVTLGISTIITGVGSAFYHASLTFIGQFFDILGMFMIAGFMLVYALERIWTLRLKTTIGLYLLLNLSLSWLQFAIPDTRRYVFALLLVMALIFEAYYRRQNAPNITVNKLHLGVSLLTLAYIIWILDNTRILCAETSLLQGHALWHLLGAVAVWFLYEYYASETVHREER